MAFCAVFTVDVSSLNGSKECDGKYGDRLNHIHTTSLRDSISLSCCSCVSCDRIENIHLRNQQ